MYIIYTIYIGYKKPASFEAPQSEGETLTRTMEK